MSLHQERVIAEKQELDKNRENLVAFINTPDYVCLAPVEKKLIQDQSKIMNKYSNILKQRINSWKVKKQ